MKKQPDAIKVEMQSILADEDPKNPLTDEQLAEKLGIRRERVVALRREAVEKARLYLPELQQKLCYFLAIHLSTFADRVRRGVYWKLTLDVHDISTRYQREYEVACILARDLGEKLELELPPEEIGMLAMYLYTFSHADVQEEPQVRVLVLSHGRVASAMAEVANRLLNMNEAIGIDMDFSESQDVMLEKVIQVVEEVDAGKGCLLLVDIGSLTTLAERITERTGIRTACVERVDTAMVLEAVRRAALTTVDLDEIAAALRLDKFGAQDGVAGDRLPALLFVCISGEGTARRLLEYIRQRSEVASLERSVLWEHNFMVDLVFLLALRETDQKYIDAFYHIAMDKQELQSLKEAASPRDMYEILTKKQN